MTENLCCDEYERMSALSRRRFLGGVAAAGATAVSTNLFGEAVRQATFGETTGNVLVVLSCRGGLDGLGAVVPHGDAAYYSARPTIALPRNALASSKIRVISCAELLAETILRINRADSVSSLFNDE